MALVVYDDSESDENEEVSRPALASTKTAAEKRTVKIGLPFNNLVSLDSLFVGICYSIYMCQVIGIVKVTSNILS